MYLKYLTIKDKEHVVIRHVDFKMGANIIMGETAENDDTTNTNSIGKTTLIRSLDFCLGGKWESMVVDREIRKIRNNTVFNFFKDTSPNFELLLVKDLEDTVTNSLKINRTISVSFTKNDKEKVSITNFINDERVSESTFMSKIKVYLFGLELEKPTFRQLIPKFIRTSDYQVSNIVKYLHPSTSHATYELIHFFLFDFTDMNLVRQRITTEEELVNITERVKSLKQLVSTGTQEATDLKVSELNDLKNQYERYEISTQYEREKDSLNLLKESIEKIKSQITLISLDIQIWQERLEEIRSNTDLINSESIAFMYKEAELYNVDLQKKFEETVEFHKAMLDNEVTFIINTISKNNNIITELKELYAQQTGEYNQLLKKLGESGSLAEYTQLGNQINHLTKEIAETEAILNSYQSTLEKQSELKSQFEFQTNKLYEALSDFRRKLTIFNRYFSEFSKDLAKDGYLLAVEEDRNKHFTLQPSPVDGDGHVGDGNKQSVVIAFDLAYMAYATDPSVGLTRPCFFTQDKVEIIDGNRLSPLIELANSINCQFIFPVIKDKQESIPGFDENNVILALTQESKFFDIENYQANKKSLSLRWYRVPYIASNPNTKSLLTETSNDLILKLVS